MSELGKEYDDFMKWFKENHPELCEKYGRNITIPFKEGEGVGVNNFKLSQEEFDLLTKIAHKYYESPKQDFTGTTQFL